MGSLPDETGRSTLDDETQYEVILTRPFYIQETEVTQKQWKALMGTNPSYFHGDDLPVERISWVEVQSYIEKLNQKNEGFYRLPTEAEWEYVARAETSTPYFFGEDSSLLGDYAWYKENANKSTHPVGQKKPNPWGLYDIYGNVFEMVQDWYDDYPIGIATNPRGPFRGESKANRGGSWVYSARYCRSAQRYSAPKNFAHVGLGFRLVRELEK